MSITAHSAHAPILMDAAGLIAPLDPWLFLDAEQGIEDAADIVLDIDRLEQSAGLLAHRNGRLGVILQPGEAVERLVPFLDKLALIAIVFPSFKDGRGFSSARIVRERMGFAGEIRAIGDVLIDQLAFMLRCGFTSFALRHPDPKAAFAAAIARFPAHYQSASARTEAIPCLRHKEARNS